MECYVVVGHWRDSGNCIIFVSTDLVETVAKMNVFVAGLNDPNNEDYNHFSYVELLAYVGDKRRRLSTVDIEYIEPVLSEEETG